MNLQKLIKELKKQGLYDEWSENRSYWRKRAEELENLLTSKAQNFMSDTELYDKLTERLKMEMLEWYSRYNPQTIAETETPLSEKELSNFKKVISGYIGVELIDGAWRKHLKNLQNRKSIARYEEIYTKIRQSVEEYTYQVSIGVDNLMKDVFETSYHHTFYSSGSKVIKIDGKSYELVAKTPWASDGSNFSERIWGKYRPELVRKLEIGLKNNIIKGEKPDKLIDLIQKESHVDRNKVARLVYTEKGYFQSKGQYEAFKNLGVKQYEFVATLDLKTSQICRYMDGKVFELSEFEIGVTAPPLHPNCRSVTAPFYDEITERIQRDPETGKSRYGANMTYDEWYEKNVKISGALDPYSKEAEKHAEMYYESIRKMKNDTEKIAKNTGYNKELIDEIKRYTFIDEHDLGYNKPRRFDPSYDMAVSWERLIVGKDIRDHDLLLLEHEMYELILVKDGIPQSRAHDMTNEIYNYTKAVERSRNGKT